MTDLRALRKQLGLTMDMSNDMTEVRNRRTTMTKLERLLTETVGVQDELDRLYLRMDARGDAAAEFSKAVKRIHGEVKQLVVRIRDIQRVVDA